MALLTTAQALMCIPSLLHQVSGHTGHDRRWTSSTTATTATTAACGSTSTTTTTTCTVTVLLLVAALCLRLGSQACTIAATLRLQGVDDCLGDAVVQRYTPVIHVDLIG